MADLKPCPLKRKGKPSIEWYKGDKPQYYCYGWIDSMTDELLEQCRRCDKHVSKAQKDLDIYNRRANNG